MTRKLVLYALAILLGGCGICAAQAQFSTRREFGPVRFSQEQLLELLSRLQAFAEQQGSTTGESDGSHQVLELSDGMSRLVISEEISLEALAPSGKPPRTFEGCSRVGRPRTNQPVSLGTKRPSGWIWVRQ